MATLEVSGASAKHVDPGECTLLIVDDIEANRDLLARRFLKRGFRVLLADNGTAALETIAAEPVDLVILDVMMPDISGLDVLKELRRSAQTAALPVIMATARSDSDDVVEALDLGATDYVTKPIDFPVLHARVLAALRAAQASRKRSRPRTLGPGCKISDRYQLGELIGEGGFGAVYRAQHLALDRPVAVKLLHAPQLSKDALTRFQREGMTACRVQHPNALAVLDSGVTDHGVAFLVMELLEGHTLEDEVRERGISMARAGNVVAAICEALAAAHAAGIVHRDVKPANIFLHQSGAGEVPKVLDFGIAKLMSDAATSGITVEGWIVGTPAYMAPERFGSHRYDGKSDVYSVGVMLHKLVAGRMPFGSAAAGGAEEPMALAMMHTHEPPIPLRAHRPEAPEELETVVLDALAKRAEDRPTAAQLAKAVRRAVAGLPDEPASGLVRTLERAAASLATEKTAVITRDLAPTMPMRVEEGDGDAE